MSATAFQRARRAAAQTLNLAEETAPLGYSEASVGIEQPDPDLGSEAAVAAVAVPTSPAPVSREQRIVQLQAENWEVLRDLLKSYGLSTHKPKGVSWDEFAIPPILTHEGL